MLGKTGLRLQLGHGGRPFALQHHGHGVAPLGDSVAGTIRSANGSEAKTFAHGHPGTHGAGHGDGVDATLGRCTGVLAVLAVKVIRRPGLRRAARGVETMQDWPSQRRQNASPPGHCPWVRKQPWPQQPRRRHPPRCPLPQHAQPRLHRQRVRGGHHIARKQRQARAGVGRLVVEVHGDPGSEDGDPLHEALRHGATFVLRVHEHHAQLAARHFAARILSVMRKTMSKP